MAKRDTYLFVTNILAHNKSMLCVILFVFLSLTSKGQNSSFPHGKVQWISLEEAQEKIKTNPKPILLDIYTNWCGWCKRMMLTTYSDDQIANYVNNNFYPVAFNAETYDTINYRGTNFTNPYPAGSARSTHNLIREIFKVNGYPATFFIDPDFQFIRGAGGYLKPNDLAPYLVYYKENLHRDLQVEEFASLFQEAFQPDSTIKKEAPKWINFNEALELQKTKPKKIMVYIPSNNGDNCLSCHVMKETSFNIPSNSAYINETFYPVYFPAESTDTLNYRGQLVANSLQDGPYHSLVNAIAKDNLRFPLVAFLNEDGTLLTIVPQFLSPSFMPKVMSFFGDEKYKTMEFGAYLKESETPVTTR